MHVFDEHTDRQTDRQSVVDSKTVRMLRSRTVKIGNRLVRCAAAIMEDRQEDAQRTVAAITRFARR